MPFLEVWQVAGGGAILGALVGSIGGYLVKTQKDNQTKKEGEDALTKEDGELKWEKKELTPPEHVIKLIESNVIFSVNIEENAKNPILKDQPRHVEVSTDQTSSNVGDSTTILKDQPRH